MSSTIKIGTGEFPLASAPQITDTMAYIQIVKSDTVTGEVVYAAVKDADSFTVVTDGTAGTAQTGYKFVEPVGVSDVLTVELQKLNTDQTNIKSLQKTSIQSQIAIGILESTTKYAINNTGV